MPVNSAQYFHLLSYPTHPIPGYGSGFFCFFWGGGESQFIFTFFKKLTHPSREWAQGGLQVNLWTSYNLQIYKYKK